MILNELLYLLNKHLKASIVKFPQSSKYIIQAYNNVSKRLQNSYKISQKITRNDIDVLDITKHMKEKLIFLLTQKIPSNEIKKIKEKQLINELTNISGIGKIKAINLIKMGLTKKSDLNKKKYFNQLNDDTKLIMKYKPLKCIPYNNIKQIEKKLTGFPNTQIVGGYRRKKPFSKDIDVMLVSNNVKDIDKYLEYLKTKFKEIHVYSQGNDKASLILQVNLNSGINLNKYYKIDIFRSPIKYRYAMLLYSTGSKEFNIRMRNIASKMGYLLNQNGLYKKGSNTPLVIKSEHDFFKKLKMKYIEPENR